MELLHHADNGQGVEEKHLRPLLVDHLSDVQEFLLLNEHPQNYSEAYPLKMFPINDASELIPQHTFVLFPLKKYRHMVHEQLALRQPT